MTKGARMVLCRFSLLLLLTVAARVSLAASGIQEVTFPTVRKAIKLSEDVGKAQPGHNTVVFHGRHINLVVIAVQPGKPDTTYEVHGLVNPLLVIPSGARVRLTVINMDFGGGMAHQLVIGTQGPPYPRDIPIGSDQDVVVTPALPPRTAKSVSQARYYSATVRFQVPDAAQHLYYFCATPGHAAKGMHGRLDVSTPKSGAVSPSS